MEEGFLTDLRGVEFFFRVCRRYHIDSREDRTALMRQIARRGKAKYMRDVAAFTEGKSVLKITRKREDHAN